MNALDVLQWLFGGGGLLAIISLQYAIKKARSEAEGEIERRWHELNDEVQDEMTKLRERLTQLEEKNEMFHNAILSSYTCRVMREHPDIECPVLKMYKEVKNGKQT